MTQSPSKVDDWEVIEIVVRYLINCGEVTPDDFIEVLQAELPPETGEKIMTVAEQLIAKGRQQGMQQGMQQVAKNLLTNGFDLQTVAKNTGLDLALLRQLRDDETKH